MATVAKDLLHWLLNTAGADNGRKIDDYGGHTTVEIVMTRKNYQTHVEPLVESGIAVLTKLEKVEKNEVRKSETGGGVYRYRLIFYKYQNGHHNQLPT